MSKGLIEKLLAAAEFRNNEVGDLFKEAAAALEAKAATSGEAVAVLHNQHGFCWYKGKKPAPGAELFVAAQPSAVPEGFALLPVEMTAEFSQFLSAVMDAAGLVRHGRQSKELSEYLGSQCMKYRLSAAPSAPATVQGVNQQLLEALNGMLLHIREPESESEFQWPEHFKKQKAAFAAAHAAIAAARQPSTAPATAQGGGITDSDRLAFMLAKPRKVVVEHLPRRFYAVYVEEGVMGDYAYPEVTFKGDRWENDSDEAQELKRRAIDAAINESRGVSDV